MDEILIREMQEHDIPEILEIEWISFSSPWSEAAFLSEINKSYSVTRVAVSGNIIIGYICVNYVLDECHILNLAVHPDFRRKGMATVLMKKVLQELRQKDCRFFYLEVRMSNMGAQRFYERFGFRFVGIRKKYYMSPVEDAALMMLRM